LGRIEELLLLLLTMMKLMMMAAAKIANFDACEEAVSCKQASDHQPSRDGHLMRRGCEGGVEDECGHDNDCIHHHRHIWCCEEELLQKKRRLQHLLPHHYHSPLFLSPHPEQCEDVHNARDDLQHRRHHNRKHHNQHHRRQHLLINNIGNTNMLARQGPASLQGKQKLRKCLT
jgi:hypothetical protein